MDPPTWDGDEDGEDEDEEDEYKDKDKDEDEDEDDSDFDLDLDLDELSNNWKEPISRARAPATSRKERRTSTRTSPSKARSPPSPPAPPKFHSATAGLKTPVRGVGRRFYAPTMSERDEDSDDIFTTPPVNTAKNSIFARPKTPLIQSSVPTRPVTPPPRHQLHPTTPKSNTRLLGSPGRGLRDDLITDVFALLVKGGVNLKESARGLRELLKRQVLQKEGISQGREVARQALVRKNKECTQLKAQVKELEEQMARAEITQETLQSQVFELASKLGM